MDETNTFGNLLLVSELHHSDLLLEGNRGDASLVNPSKPGALNLGHSHAPKVIALSGGFPKLFPRRLRASEGRRLYAYDVAVIRPSSRNPRLTITLIIAHTKSQGRGRRVRGGAPA